MTKISDNIPAAFRLFSHSYTQIIHQDVLTALGHDTAVPVPHNFKPVSFSSNTDTILMASFAAYKILAGSDLLKTDLYLDPTTRLRVIWKLLNYLRRSGLQSPSAIQHFTSEYAAPIAQVLAHRPKLITGSGGFAAVIRQIPRQPRYAALCDYFEAHYPTDPRPVIWTNRLFYLEQLTTKSHVLFQGLYHRNCLAGHFTDFLDKHGLPIRDQYLPPVSSLKYWHRMKAGHLHLLSFSDANHIPITTLAICPPLSMLTSIYGAFNQKTTGAEHYFPSLINSIAALNRSIPGFRVADDIFQCPLPLDIPTARLPD